MSDVKPPRKLTTKQAAGLLEVSVKTLERWRRERNSDLRWFHPKGTRPFYLLSDVLAYLDSGAREPISSKRREQARSGAPFSAMLPDIDHDLGNDGDA